MRIPIILAVSAFIISVLIDLYITHDIRKSAKNTKWWKIYLASSIACWIFLIVIVFLPKRDESSEILGIMWMLYSYLTIYAAKLIYTIISLAGKLIKLIFRIKPKKHYAQWGGLLCGFVFLGIMFAGVVFTRSRIEVNRIEIDSPKIPRDFNGFKIAQISDLHVGTWGNDTTFISNLVDSINSLKPDLIVFTGDIVNRKTEELHPFIKTLSRLKAPYGVMSILGNHDYGDYVDWKNPSDRDKNNEMLASHQKDMGWDLLNNRKEFIVKGNDSIMVVGVENWGDPPFPTYGDLDHALSPSADSVFNQNDHRFKILLTHNPEHWNQVISKSTNIDLTLSGHTHAMQMMISLGDWKWSPARYRYEQWGGLYERFNDKGHPTRLYVNIGAGEVGMPSRLLDAYPEITLITLKHQQN